jgi:hypothetical protein
MQEEQEAAEQAAKESETPEATATTTEGEDAAEAKEQ